MKAGIVGMLSLVVLFSRATAAKPQDRPSRPDHATIYRDGYAYFTERLDAGDGHEIKVRLPAGTDLASIKVFQGNERIGSLEIEEIFREEELKIRSVVVDYAKFRQTDAHQVLERIEKAKKRIGYFLRLQGSGKRTLSLQYGVSGISWEPQLDAVILDRQKMSVGLTARIVNNSLDLKNCEIRLASSAGQMSGQMYFASSGYQAYRQTAQAGSRSADVVYDIGRHNVMKDRTSLITFLSGTSAYQKKYIWHTDTRDRVRAVLMTKNPFELPLCPAESRLYDRSSLLAQDSTEWSPPGEPIFLAAGNATGIEVERSVTTTENLSKQARARPFNHSIRFKVTNQARHDVRLEVIMPKQLGHQHKTIYNFGRKPDRRPGELYIWDLNLKSGRYQVIAFNFDSEYPRFAAYQSYEKARYAH